MERGSGQVGSEGFVFEWTVRWCTVEPVKL